MASNFVAVPVVWCLRREWRLLRPDLAFCCVLYRPFLLQSSIEKREDLFLDWPVLLMRAQLFPPLWGSAEVESLLEKGTGRSPRKKSVVGDQDLFEEAAIIGGERRPLAG